MIKRIALLYVVVSTLASVPSFANDDSALLVAKEFILSLTERDAVKTLQLLSEDAILEMPFPLAAGENKYGTRKMWGDALRKYVKGITERNSHIAFENAIWRTAGDGVVVLECDGDMIRSKDGMRYQNKYIVLFEVTNGRITLWREYFNPVVAARTFGIPLESLPY
jgi:ketosteroid isomerase-like protein